MRILITGGAGFIGANFVHYWALKHPKDEIVNVDLLTYASDLTFLRGLETKRYEFVHGDIANRALMMKLVKDVDAVVNFAAESHVDRSIQDSAQFIHSNVVGVHSILEAVRKYEKRFNHISTDEVYGSLALGSKRKFNESSPYSPSSPYSASKAAADHLVMAYFHTYKIPATISNCSNNYGRFQHQEKLIPKIIIGSLLNRPIQLHGKGTQVRDWIYVEDHCSAVEAVLKKGEPGNTYVIGADGEKNVVDVAKTILKLLDRPASLISFRGERPGEDIRYALDPTKIRKELGWRPAYSFEHGIRLTVDYYWGRYEKK
jgi:dTDP-glucose 4,6-dehydratase